MPVPVTRLLSMRSSAMSAHADVRTFIAPAQRASLGLVPRWARRAIAFSGCLPDIPQWHKIDMTRAVSP
jgi:hypothetical protein